MSVIEVRKPAEVTVGVTRRDVLHRAADLLEEFGWTQNSEARTADGRCVKAYNHDAVAFCAGGAVDRACFDLAIPEWTYEEIADLIGQGYADWNDDPRRTKAQVVARLREVADVS
jgi:hypothetical protein